MTWTRITDPDQTADLLPAWFASRMIGLRGRFGLLLTTGDVLKITSVSALLQSAGGVTLLDVLLDDAGVPEGVDFAWRHKHYLGAPVPGASMATVNLAHVVGAVEFVAEATVEQPDELVRQFGDANDTRQAATDPLAETIEQANALTVGASVEADRV